MSNEEVKVKISADSSSAEAGFARVSKGIKDFNNETASSVKMIKEHWMGVSAAIIGVSVAANKAWGMIKAGAEFEEQTRVLDNLTKKYSTSADAIVGAMQRASEGMVARADLMQVALGGIAKGLKPEQLINLADAAKILGDTVGKNTTTALQELTTALETGKAKGLKGYMGATLDLNDAFGELEKQMTATDRVQAMYLMTMIHATKLQNEQGEALDSTADKVERLESKWKDLMTTMSTGMKTAVVGLDEWLGKYVIGPIEAFPTRVRNMGLEQAIFGPKHGATGPGVVTVPEIGAEKKPDALKQYEDQMAGMKKMMAERAALEEGNKQSIKDAEKAARDLERQAKETARAIQKATEDAISDMAHEADKGYRETIDSLKRMADYTEMMDTEKAFTTDPHQDAINRVLKAERKKFAAIQDMQDRHLIAFEQAEKDKQLIAENSAKKIAEINKDLYQRQLGDLSSGFGNLASAFQDIASVYGEGSEAAQRWLEAAKAMEIAQRAVAVVQAVVAIATQGSGDPYTAFARIAAMAAAMGSLLATIGASVSGGSTAAASAPAMGNSTVLGAEYGAASESIANSLEILQETYDLENSKLTKIYDELKNLNSNISGLVSTYIRTGSMEGFSSKIPTYDRLTGAATTQEKFMDLVSGRKITDAVFGKDTPIGNIVNFLFGKGLQIFSSLYKNMFGGEITTVMVSSGIQIGKTLIESVVNGMQVDAKQFALYAQKTSGGYFGNDKMTAAYVYNALDASVVSLVSNVFSGMGSTLVELAKGLGTDVNKVLAYSFGEIKLNLKGKDGEAIGKAISEALSAAGDNAAKALFGEMISRYQQVNEGMLETAVRLVTDKESVLAVLRLTNQSFTGTTSKLIEFSEALISVAGNLEELTDAFQTYYDAFFSDAEKQADTKRALSAALGMYGFDLPGSRSGYRELVESLNLTTEAGQAAYVALMKMSESADAYYDYLEKAKSDIRESDYSTRAEYLRAVNAPRFAEGGYHAGGYRIVGEYGPELERTGPSSIYNTSNTRKALGTDDLIAEVQKLRQETGEVNFTMASTSLKLAKLLDKWDGEGLPAERT
jgi:hypothetical protein